MRPTVLVCDDDDAMRFLMRTVLEDAGHQVTEAPDGDDALVELRRAAPDCLVLDLVMPRMGGLAVLEVLHAQGSEVPVVVVTATGGIDAAIAATRLGAVAFLQKPFDHRELVLAVERARGDERLRREVQVLRGRVRAEHGAFVGRSKALEPLFAALHQLETVPAQRVLLLGESGTGKDVVARALHSAGPRKNGVFVEVDCTALPEHLAESELFGHEKGAFTDAKATKRGLLEVAAGGVLFLDEIGELPLPLQAKFLRALENRTFKRVGGVTTIKFDAQVVAATNRDLKAEVDAGRFREDLYYRLNVVSLRIPPLRERTDDLPLLVDHFLTQLNREFGRSIRGVETEAMRQLAAYSWPGNVRELKNVLERIALLGAPTHVRVEDLPPELTSPARRPAAATPAAALPGAHPFHLPDTGIVLEEVERDFIVQALERTRGNQAAAARLLGLSRFRLRYRIEKFGLAAVTAADDATDQSR
jgi:DNA-binding NtrC family response regulator